MESYRYGDERELAFYKQKITQTKVFIVSRENGAYTFAPVRFAAYLSNDMENEPRNPYSDAGTRIITKLVGPPIDPASNDYNEIDVAFIKLCESIKKPPSEHKRERSYWLLENTPSPTRSNHQARNPDWLQDELIVALAFYMRHRNKMPDKKSKEIVELSADLGSLGIKLHGIQTPTFRNANGVYMKLMNFRSLDPNYTAGGGVGLKRGGGMDQIVWKQFAGDPPHLFRTAETILAAINSDELSPGPDNQEEDDTEDPAEGRVINRMHKTRERNRGLVKRKKANFLSKHGQTGRGGVCSMRGPQPCMPRRDFLITSGGEWSQCGACSRGCRADVHGVRPAEIAAALRHLERRVWRLSQWGRKCPRMHSSAGSRPY